jgi:hypothetical protein
MYVGALHVMRNMDKFLNPSALKVDPPRYLQQTRCVGLRADDSERTRSLCLTRIAELYPVEDIEEFRSQLQLHSAFAA